jgi:hypothetical protein
MTLALATDSVSSRLRQHERSIVASCVIDRPHLPVGAWRAVAGYLRPLAVLGILGDEREPASCSVRDTTAFLAPEHRRSIIERLR